MRYRVSVQIYILGLINVITASSPASPAKEPPLLVRNLRLPPKLKARDSVDFSAFPKCAYANCVASDQFSPSRLGCISSNLTTDCFCTQAPTPLDCAPTGPSDSDNCWYDLENWFAGVCGNMVATLQFSTMPDCVQDCASNYIIEAGCRSETRNCFCKIDRMALLNATTVCQSQNCSSKMQSSFVPSLWRDNICLQGWTNDYDQASYDSYVKRVHDTRIAVPVVMCIIAFALICAGITSIDNAICVAYACWIGAIILLIVTIVPVYTVL